MCSVLFPHGVYCSHDEGPERGLSAICANSFHREKFTEEQLERAICRATLTFQLVAEQILRDHRLYKVIK